MSTVLGYEDRKALAADKLLTLPKWAQEFVRSLQGERDVAVRELRKFEASKIPTRIWTESNACLGEKVGQNVVIRYLDPDINWVHFKVGEGEYQEVQVGFQYQDGRFLVRSPRSQMKLVLDCANTIEVRIS